MENKLRLGACCHLEIVDQNYLTIEIVGWLTGKDENNERYSLAYLRSGNNLRI